MAHALATDLRPRNLDATPVANNPFEPDPFVLAAVALPILGGTENALTEQPILLRLESPVIDGLRLGDLAI